MMLKLSDRLKTIIPPRFKEKKKTNFKNICKEQKPIKRPGRSKKEPNRTYRNYKYNP